jgi:hypothetical protein
MLAMSTDQTLSTSPAYAVRPDELLSMACIPPEGLSLMLRNQYERGFRDACQKAYGLLLARLAATTAEGEGATDLPAYEVKFQEAVTELVMRHIDRMNDICEQDPAERIIQSFVSGFDPLFQAYLEAKFPGRETLLRRSKSTTATEG